VPCGDAGVAIMPLPRKGINESHDESVLCLPPGERYVFRRQAVTAARRPGAAFELREMEAHICAGRGRGGNASRARWMGDRRTIGARVRVGRVTRWRGSVAPKGGRVET